MIAATVTCAAAATEASAQSQDGSVVLNNQLQLGDVIAGETLIVVDAASQVNVSVSAQGNSFSGSVENDSIDVQSTQDMQGDAVATADMTFGGDTEGVVTAVIQAGGNYLAAGAYDADVAVHAGQLNTGGEVSATASIDGGTARLIGGAAVTTSAISNTVSMGGQGSTLSGVVSQGSSATVRSSNYAATQYIPAQAVFSSLATANGFAATSDAASNQSLYVRQRSTGDLIEAGVSVNAGNAWDLAGRSRATGNTASFTNQGGALIAETDQANSAYVRATAVTTAYDFGRAEAHARAAGNDVSVGNNDIYVEIDNTQLNTGGVDASAVFSGNTGYDAYVGADAVGNSIVGYACSECAGRLNAANVQQNDGDVSATTSVNVAGGGRAAMTGANAVGNAATFYVSRPSH